MQRIDLADLDHAVIRQWESSTDVIVQVGVAGQRWFAWHSGKGAAWVYGDERSMADRADRWLARGRWTEVSAGVSDPAR